MGLIGRLFPRNINPQARPDRQHKGCAVTKASGKHVLGKCPHQRRLLRSLSRHPNYQYSAGRATSAHNSLGTCGTLHIPYLGPLTTAHLVQIRGEYTHPSSNAPVPTFFFATAVTFYKCLISELTSPKFAQPLLIFLSVAGALGVTAGISLHFSSGYMHQLLDIRTGGEDNEYTNKKRKFTVDNGSSSNSDLTNPRQKTSDGRKHTTSAGSSRASLRDIMRAQNKPWLARNRNEEQTAMTSLWQVPAFKNERKEVTKRDDENEIESEQVPRGERNREDLLATIILEEEEDDDYGEGEVEEEEVEEEEEEEEEDNEI
ncbi:predicted protein [Histoplasma mississippiense (nom. inval.)]|uniref:predicted protein n=1 Tax=Ajellomyces capsulatus (strain NAm1 / WU24) TaxID=2059318 RepID=UPI000157D422|nr:predicted protein [Histoplasma mississippiense (nom. inval.)]EDN04575.1 predicted protein [Histoplasma mississippiense (nom. inval.)]